MLQTCNSFKIADAEGEIQIGLRGTARSTVFHALRIGMITCVERFPVYTAVVSIGDVVGNTGCGYCTKAGVIAKLRIRWSSCI